MSTARWHQITQLYHAALECEVSRRAAFLDEACLGDDGLRQEVEGFLKAGGPRACHALVNNVVDGDDVRMIEGRSGASFLKK